MLKHLIKWALPKALAIGDTATTGTSKAMALADHGHPMPSFGSPVAVGTANADGSSVEVPHADHQHDSPVFVASGGSHAQGSVPDPGASAGTTRFLREDASWAVPATNPVGDEWMPDDLMLMVGGIS